MTALHTTLRLTVIAAAAALALTACDRGADDSTQSTTTGSADSRPADTAPGGSGTPTPSSNTGSTGTTTGSATDSTGTTGSTPGSTTGSTTGTTGSSTGTGTTTGSAADTPTGATGSSTSAANTTGTQSPESMMSTNPPAAGSTGTGASTASLAAADRTFVETAAGAGMYEVAVAKLAADKASDPAVKSYAAMLVEHHTAANDKLKQVATSRNVQLPSSIPADKQRTIDQLSRASGPAFDREFVQTVGIKDHQADIALFERASRNAKDPEIKSFAESTLPTLREHLTQAQKLPVKKG